MAKGKAPMPSGGIDALREHNTRNASKISTSAMDGALRNAYTRLGVAPELFDGIHTTLDLSTELRAARANVVRFANMLAAGEAFLISPNGTALSVEMLYGQSLMIVRHLVKAQHEVAPGAERNGDIRLTIRVDGLADADSDEDEVPDLTDEDSSFDPAKAEPEVGPPESTPNQTGYEDES